MAKDLFAKQMLCYAQVELSLNILLLSDFQKEAVGY